MRDRAPTSFGATLVTAAMRAGYAARGFVYLVVGAIALAAAATGGRAEGLLGSLGRLKGQPWNEPILLMVALGLVLYAVWRGLDALLDLAGHGRGFGWVERGGLFFVAALHVGFAWYAMKLAFEGASFATQSGIRAGHLMAELMRSGSGRWFIVLAGIGTISFGAFSIRKGALGPYRRHMRPSRRLDALAPLLGFGLIARGIVLVVMGGFITWAGWTLDVNAAGGYGHALEQIHNAWHGRTLLGIVGIGLVAFAFYCFIEAAFRVIPNLPGGPGARDGQPGDTFSAR